MTEANYEALTVACDHLLRMSGPAPERVAVPWLHVLSEHTNNLAQYEPVFQARRGTGRLRRLASVARTLSRALLSPGVEPAEAAGSGPLDVLLVSHHVGDAPRAGAPADFYYGDLAVDLARRGLNVLTIALNHTCVEWTGPRAEDERPGGKRIVMPLALEPRREIDILRRSRLARAALMNDAAAARTPFEYRVAAEAAAHAVSGPTSAALRLHDVMRRLCARARPRAVMVTWEGHAWERLVFHAARSIDPGVRCIAYQHTVLFPRSHALKRTLGGAYDPDVMLTTGDANRDLLQEAPGLRGIPVITYGSHRRSVVSGTRARDATSRCLVIPEGLERECVQLFDFAVRAAARLPETEFLLRSHPVLPFERLARRHRALRRLPPNVRVSDTRDIGADFERCAWALYRGSSAAIYAVLAGLRPVYIERDGELPFDPLFAMRGWRRRLSTVDALDELLRIDRAMSGEVCEQEWQPARAFCERYVALPDSNVVYDAVSRRV